MSSQSGLTLHPFHGVRYAAHTVDVGAVTSPPYDLIAPDDVDRLERQEPHNVVRLVLAERGVTDGYARARTLLHRWLASGVLTSDPAPALYAYEQRGSGFLQRGLLGGVGLSPPEDRVVLPHEDVHPGPVADRFEQMRATRANLEPIYLLVQGLGTDPASAAADGTHPLIEAETADGTRHRLWIVDDPERLAAVADALRDKQALIADGHHRYATYRKLQAAYRDAHYGPGPWDAGLALLVDSTAYPPTLQPIHRVVAGLRPETLLASLPDGSSVRPAGPTLQAALDELAELPRACGAHQLVAGDGAVRLVTVPRHAADAALPAGHSPAWRRLDVSVLHHAVLTRAHIRDDDLTFLHDAAAAVRRAEQDGGTAVLLNPPAVDQVFAVAAAADRMPPKSTSFGPKSRNGWVFRLLDAELRQQPSAS